MVDKIRKTKSLRRLKMSEALREVDKIELVNIKRLAHLLKSLSPAELETLEILLDEEAYKTIVQSLEELRKRQGIPIDEW
jgi:hypothetical protein